VAILTPGSIHERKNVIFEKIGQLIRCGDLTSAVEFTSAKKVVNKEIKTDNRCGNLFASGP